MYLGALVLLYRQLLVATAESQLMDGASVNPNFSPQDTRGYRNECALAAQQIARLLGLISFNGTLTKRCWICIYWSFTAAVVLLFSTTTKLLDGQSDTVEEDLNYAKSSMDMLERCRTSEPVAARYLDTLWPLYDSLQDMRQRIVGRHKTSIFALLESDPSLLSPAIAVSKQELAPISEKLSSLLLDPFGRKQGLPGDSTMRRVLNADGSCCVFWWK